MKNFLHGVGSVINLFPTHKLSSKTVQQPKRSDTDAMRSDWEKVGTDMRWVVENSNISEKK